MLSEILKDLRARKRISQAALAEVLEVTQQAVQRWERGKARPDVESLEKLSDYFKVSTDYLLGRSGNNYCQLLSSEQEQLIDDYSKLNKTNQKIITYTMKAFLTNQAASVFGSAINNNNGNGNFFANSGNNFVMA